MYFQAIIFDFDGVILESVEAKALAFEKLYRGYGEDIQNEVREFHLANPGMSRYDKFNFFEEKVLQLGPLSLEKQVQLNDEFTRYVAEYTAKAPLVSGALDALQKLSQELPLYVATAAPEAEIIPFIQNINLDPYFKEIRGYPEPKGYILRNIVKNNHYNPSKVLMIGDSLSDYKAAQEADVLFWGRQLTTEFPEGTYTINNLLSLYQKIKSYEPIPSCC